MAKKDRKEELIKEIDSLGLEIDGQEDEMTIDELEKILKDGKEELGITGEKKVEATKPLPIRQAAKKKAADAKGTLCSLDDLRKFEAEGRLKTVHQVGFEKYKITLN